ncbi:MAG: TadE/TadG family type IV pilus assembly protein [Planctomycetaceae bacterium]
MKLIRRHRSSQSRNEDRRGAAMVEMAVCFPVFMLMLLGIIEFGRALMVSQLLTSAARQGCREAIIDGATNNSVTSDIRTAVVNTVGCRPEDVGIEIVVTSVADDSEVPLLADAEQRDLVEVEISIAFNAVSLTSGKFLAGQMLRGRCSMRKE